MAYTHSPECMHNNCGSCKANWCLCRCHGQEEPNTTFTAETPEQVLAKLRRFHGKRLLAAIGDGEEHLAAIHNAICDALDRTEERERQGRQELPDTHVEIIHQRSSEPDKHISDMVEWPGHLPRTGETLIVWGDDDAFQYQVRGVTHHVETKGGDRLVKVTVYVGLYDERAPRGPVEGGAGEW